MRKTPLFLLSLACTVIAGCHAASPPPSASARPTLIHRSNDDQQATNRADAYNASPASNDNVDATTFMSTFRKALAWPFVALGHQLDLANGHTPGLAVRQMDQGATPDERRNGIVDLVTSWEFARHPPYTTRYKEIAQNDPDFTVRAMAIRALNISRDSTATPIFIAALADDQELVRLEAAKALANIPDANAIPILLRCVQGRRRVISNGEAAEADESKDVRIAAADALRNYRTFDVARALVGSLNERDYDIAWQSHQSLTILTGIDLKYDQDAWLKYLTGPNKPFG